MEGKTSFSIDNISSNCFVNFNPYFDSAVLDQSMSFSASFDISDESSLIELDPQMPPSKRFYRVSKDFSIDFQSSSSSPDQFRISDACYLLPIFVQQLSKAERPLDHDRYYDDHGGKYSSILSTPRSVSLLSQREELPSDDIPCSTLRRCRIISKRILHKYLDFFRPLCRKLRCRPLGSGSKVASVSTQANSPSSPATSPVHSVVGVSNKKKVLGSYDSEFCIHDAVLHCKRTNDVSPLLKDAENKRTLTKHEEEDDSLLR